MLTIIVGIVIFGIIIAWIGNVLLSVAYPRDETIRPRKSKTDQKS